MPGTSRQGAGDSELDGSVQNVRRHAWYAGGNTQHAPVANATGCCDGLDAEGVNRNMGAESTICYLMSAIALATRSTKALRSVG